MPLANRFWHSESCIYTYPYIALFFSPLIGTLLSSLSHIFLIYYTSLPRLCALKRLIFVLLEVFSNFLKISKESYIWGVYIQVLECQKCR